MNSFPRLRNAKQYTGIEKFTKHEFRECIAFELAVRAAKDTLAELIELKTSENNNGESIEEQILRHNRIDELEKTLETKYWLKPNYFYPRIIPTKDALYQSTKKKILAVKNYGQSLQGKANLKESNFVPTKDEIAQYLPADSFYYVYYYHFLINVLPEPYKLELPIHKDSHQFPKATQNGSTVIDAGESYELVSYTDGETISERILIKKISRPSLSIPKEHNNNIIIEVNPNLPIKENIDFLQNALKDIKNKKKSLSLNELINLDGGNSETYEEEYFSHHGKTMTDMLFIYDYVNFKLKNTDLHNPGEQDIIRDEKYFLTKSTGHKLDTLLKYYRRISKLINNCEYKSLI